MFAQSPNSLLKVRHSMRKAAHRQQQMMTNTSLASVAPKVLHGLLPLLSFFPPKICLGGCMSLCLCSAALSVLIFGSHLLRYTSFRNLKDDLILFGQAGSYRYRIGKCWLSAHTGEDYRRAKILQHGTAHQSRAALW